MRKPPGGKYAVPKSEAYQSGSRGKILKNKLGITRVRLLEEKELELYMETELWITENFSSDQQLHMRDIDDIHHHFMFELYNWAGTLRTVDLSKGGFLFTTALALKSQVHAFEKVLDRCTPCRGSRKEVIRSIAEVHVEFVLLHPYREGNGRVARLLSILMAYQAGYPGLDFGFIGKKGKEFDRYIAAIHAGLDRDYTTMEMIVERALGGAEAEYA